jgi:hypothetical protein
MTTFDYLDQAQPRNRTGIIWSILTVLILLCVVCVAGVFLAIFTNPYSSLNPFPPPTLPPALALPSETPTDIVFSLPATWTPTATPEPSATIASPPSATLPATPTPITITPSPPSTEPPPPGGYPFQVRQGNPKAIPNIYHPELECNWMGVGGQVIDMSNAPVIGLITRLGGKLPGVTLPENFISLAGLALSYGRSGYEFSIAERPIASRDQLWVQLFSQAGGPLSDPIYFETYDSCEQNLIIIDFVQVRK